MSRVNFLNDEYMNKEEMDEFKDAYVDFLQYIGSEPIRKKDIKELTSKKYISYFEDVRKTALRAGDIYVVPGKGYISADSLSSDNIDIRVAHINWCLGMHETSSRQLLMDDELLLNAPDLAKTLLESSKQTPIQQTKIIIEMSKKARQMKRTLDQLSKTYDELDDGMLKLANSIQNKIKPKSIGKGLDALSKLKNIDKSDPEKCPACFSPKIILTGYRNSILECKECNHQKIIKKP